LKDITTVSSDFSHRFNQTTTPYPTPNLYITNTMGSISIPKQQWAQVAEKEGARSVYKQIDIPKPAADQVLVNIKYSGVCHTDWHVKQGDWPLKGTFPLVGGHEGAGVVVAKGELVKDIEIGDHVGVKWINSTCLACDFCQQSDEQVSSISMVGYRT
jgi:propanol-preferring alcohol dehydrogenase